MQYRDVRTDGVLDRVSAQLGEERLCATTGLQQLPFNTLYQLVAAAGTPQLAAARQMLLIPDLITYRLTGAIGAEATNASTTQLYDVRHRVWAKDLAADAGIRPDLLPPLREPGTRVGPVLAEVGLSHPIDVIAVGSHTRPRRWWRCRRRGTTSRTSHAAPGHWSASSSTRPC